MIAHPKGLARMLTDRQQSVLDFIREHVLRCGYPPTYAEIGCKFGISREGASRHVAALQKKGRIRRVYGQQRTISVVADCQPCRLPASA